MTNNKETNNYVFAREPFKAANKSIDKLFSNNYVFAQNPCCSKNEQRLDSNTDIGSNNYVFARNPIGYAEQNKKSQKNKQENKYGKE